MKNNIIEFKRVSNYKNNYNIELIYVKDFKYTIQADTEKDALQYVESLDFEIENPEAERLVIYHCEKEEEE